MNLKAFSQLITQRRMNLNYTQSKVANLCFVSKSTYNHYERGHRLPPVDTLLKLSKVLKLDFNDIIEALTTEDTDGNLNISNLIQEKNNGSSIYAESYTESFMLLDDNQQQAVMDIIDEILNIKK